MPQNKLSVGGGGPSTVSQIVSGTTYGGYLIKCDSPNMSKAMNCMVSA